MVHKSRTIFCIYFYESMLVCLFSDLLYIVATTGNYAQARTKFVLSPTWMRPCHDCRKSQKGTWYHRHRNVFTLQKRYGEFKVVLKSLVGMTAIYHATENHSSFTGQTLNNTLIGRCFVQGCTQNFIVFTQRHGIH